MDQILVKHRETVIPGTVLAQGLSFLPGDGTFRQGNSIYSKYTGLVMINDRVLSVIPLEGEYLPRKGDFIIGIIIDVQLSNWIININSPYIATLVPANTGLTINPREPLHKIFKHGDTLLLKIISVTQSKSVSLSLAEQGCRRLNRGILVEISPNKIPRVIGKRGSMIQIIKEYTNCELVIGQNGRILINGPEDKMFMAIEAIKKIDKEAYLPGLTESVKKMLEGK
jgi:exosome complex component RRP4